MEIISRKEAQEQKLKYYYTGNLCKNGHNDKRITCNALCFSCYYEKMRLKRLNNSEFRERAIKRSKSHYQNNKEKYKENQKRWRDINCPTNEELLEYKKIRKIAIDI